MDLKDILLKVDDVIQVRGNGVPEHMEKAYFKVTAIEDNGTVLLGPPYYDHELTKPFRNVDPITRKLVFGLDRIIDG